MIMCYHQLKERNQGNETDIDSKNMLTLSFVLLSVPYDFDE